MAPERLEDPKISEIPATSRETQGGPVVRLEDGILCGFRKCRSKPHFGPIETLIILLDFLFLNSPRHSLEVLSRCRVILLTHFDAPWLQSSLKIRTNQELSETTWGFPSNPLQQLSSDSGGCRRIFKWNLQMTRYRIFNMIARVSKYDFWIPGEILG